MVSALENLLLMWEISGCPVAPPMYVFAAAASAPSVWVADLPYGLSFYEQRRIVILKS
jgi:hypothetical protein